MECAGALLDIFARNGVPDTLLSDQGTQFMSILTTTLCKRLGIKKQRTTPYHPQTNGSVERLHGTFNCTQYEVHMVSPCVLVCFFLSLCQISVEHAHWGS